MQRERLKIQKIFNTQHRNALFGFFNVVRVGNFNAKSQSGFTLIEMLITLGIMAILAAATLGNINKNRDQVRLNQAVQEAAGILREAQARALSVSGAQTPADTQYPGFGVHIARDTQSLTLFPDIDRNHRYTSVGQEAAGGNNITSTFRLPPRIVVEDIIGPLGDSFGGMTVVYERPDPTIWIHVFAPADPFTPIPDTASEHRICLHAEGTSLYKIISVWATGQVAISDIQDRCTTP